MCISLLCAGQSAFSLGLSSLLRTKREPEMVVAPVARGQSAFALRLLFSFACQKRTRKAPATFEAREARERGCSPLSDPEGVVEAQKC